MPYSICGLLIYDSETKTCATHNWPVVKLAEGVELVPLDREHVRLIDGNETQTASDFEFARPDWLLEMASCFSTSAYIVASFWGGEGMQASIVLKRNGEFSEAVISGRRQPSRQFRNLATGPFLGQLPFSDSVLFEGWADRLEAVDRLRLNPELHSTGPGRSLSQAFRPPRLPKQTPLK